MDVGEREERATFLEAGGGRERDNAGRSISNMLINDPFERWIGGVGVLRILLSIRAPSIWMSEGTVSVAVWTIEKNHKRLRSLRWNIPMESKISWGTRRTAGFVRVDRISNSTASPLGITSFTPKMRGLLVNVSIFSRERMNLMIFGIIVNVVNTCESKC